jgi:hypothetical protein
MKALQVLAFSALLGAFVGCEVASPNVEDRGSYWCNSLQTFFQAAQTIESTNSWLAERDAEPLHVSNNVKDELGQRDDPSFEPLNYYFARLETISLGGYPCESMTFYYLLVWTDDSGQVSKHEIQSMGTCQTETTKFLPDDRGVSSAELHQVFRRRSACI